MLAYTPFTRFDIDSSQNGAFNLFETCVFARICLRFHPRYMAFVHLLCFNRIHVLSHSRSMLVSLLFGSCCNHLALMRLNYYRNCTAHTHTHSHIHTFGLPKHTRTHTQRLINEHLHVQLLTVRKFHCAGPNMFMALRWIDLVDATKCSMFIRYSLYDNISIYFATKITFIKPHMKRYGTRCNDATMHRILSIVPKFTCLLLIWSS